MIRGAISLVVALLGAVPALAQISQGRIVHVVTGEPGGGTDFAARLIAPGMSSNLGAPVIVENRGGASGIIAAQAVAKAAPDGNTLLFYGNPIWLLQYLRDDVPYDVEKDFYPVTIAVRSPNILVVHPSVPADSTRALIDLAKSKPGGLNYAATGSGTPNHMAAELFKAMAGVDVVKVTYKGTSAAMNGLLRGDVQLMFTTIAAVAPQIKAGKLRALAITSAQVSALLPGIPTVASSGLPGYESGSSYGIFAPGATPAATVEALNKGAVAALRSVDVREKLAGAGVEPVGSSAREFSDLIKSERSRLGKVIKDAGIRDEGN